MLRKGFTLIELLIVITIIAILAGSAIPYVQDYVEDAKIAVTKESLVQVKNALVRFELDRGISFPATSTADLVGPYLDKALNDGWGTQFEIDATSSKVLSWGPNRADDGGTGDDVSTDFRPPLSLSKAYWIDTDKNGTVSNGDAINLRFTRPMKATELNALTQTSWTVKVNGAAGAFTAATTAAVAGSPKLGKITITTAGAAALFLPGRDTINYNGTGALHDEQQAPLSPATCTQNLVAIQTL